MQLVVFEEKTNFAEKSVGWRAENWGK